MFAWRKWTIVHMRFCPLSFMLVHRTFTATSRFAIEYITRIATH